MRDTEGALRWIVEILQRHHIPFQIAGGFAAKLYGSPRSLADIDIDVSSYCFSKILHDVRSQIIFGPKQYKDQNWDLMLMTLKYKGQIIDLANDAKIFDKNQSKWVEFQIDFSNSNQMKIYDLTLPIIPKENLIAYKSKLLRKVDKEDLKALSMS